MYFVVFGTDKPDNARVREENRPSHRIHLRNPGPHPVKVRLGGATLDESGHDMNGTMLVVEADSIDAVRAFLADDPYSQAGLFATIEVRAWLWGLGNPDDDTSHERAEAQAIHRHAPLPGTLLCALDDIPEGGGYECVFGPEHERLGILLLRRGDQVWGYVNQCPHFSIPLNYEPGVFWTYDGEILMCAHHSAMFRFEDGVCFDGPCQGQRLTAIPVKVDQGKVYWQAA